MTLALYGKSKRRQGGLILAGLLAVVLSLLVGLGALQQERASAVIVALDTSTFDGTGNGVGGGWSETTGTGATNGQNASRVSGYVRLTHSDSAIWKTISTVGYTTISVDFDCRGTTTNNSGDALAVDYSANGGSTWTQVATFTTDLNSDAAGSCRDRDPFTAKSVAFPFDAEGNAQFTLRFRSINHNLSGEEVRIDNVVVKGDIQDADGDGVHDGIDQCPNTPGGAQVDSLGCSFQQYLDKVGTGTRNAVFDPNVCQAANFSFVVDRSGSIDEVEAGQMVAGINGFTNAYETVGGGVGAYKLTTFSGTSANPVTGSPGYLGLAPFTTAVNGLNSAGNSFTPTQAGITTGNDLNGASSNQHIMFVLTDGSPNRYTNPPVPPMAVTTDLALTSTWVNGAYAAINAANAARTTGFVVQAIWVETTDNMPFDSLFGAGSNDLFAKHVMDQIGGGSHFKVSGDFSGIAETLLEAAGCDPDITKTVLNVDVNAGEVSWTVEVKNDSGAPKTFWIFDDDPTATLVARTGCTNNPSVPDSTDPWECTIDGNGTASLTIVTTVNINRCEGGSGTNTVHLRESSSDSAPVIGTSTGTWSDQGDPYACEPETRNLQICKVVVGNGDLAIRSGTFNFDVRENGNTVLNGIGGINSSEPNPDTNGTNGTEVCKTVQVATDKAISVVEWGSRPAGWNGDAAGYPKYSINGGAQVANNTTSDIAAGTSDIKVTFYNKDSLPTVNVTFSKFICNSLGDIARNQEGQADDDVGKPSMSATGGLSAQLGPVGSIGNDDAVNFSNDGRNAANCHLWGSDLTNYPEETGDWDMVIYNTGRTSLLQTIHIPQGGTTTTAITQDVLLEALAPDSSGARVEEVFKTGYGFGSLKCYTDHLHQDNWEWLDFNPGGIPQGEIHCIAYNVKADKEIKIQKLFIGASFTADDYPAFTLNPVPQGFDIANCTVATSGNVVTWTCKVPYDWNGTITETPKPGWQEIPTVACRDWFADQGPNALATEHFFCNQAVGTVVIMKFENVDPSTPQNWTFTGTLPGAPFAAQTTGSSNSTHVVQQTVNNVPVGNNYTLSETQGRNACAAGTTSNDWQTHGLVKLDIAQEGPPTAADLNALPPIGTGVLGFAVVKNTVTYVAWGNRGCGTVLSSQQLQVIKYSDPLANFTGNTPLSDWEITITGTAGAATGFVATEDTNGAAGALFLGIPDGTYTVCETPKANWNVVGSRYNAVNQAGSCRTGVVLNLNETVVVNFYNQPRVNITVNKVIFNNANPQGANGGSGWTFTLNGCGIVNDSKTTGASGSVSWNDLPPAVNCTYTVTETAKAGWIADQISQNTSPAAAGSTANLTFVNRQIEGCVNINDCPPPTSTPTSTPTTPPTSTPVPGETPTTPPGETPAASPTPEETVAGEQTPGPGQPTPQAPDTGAGFGVGGSAGFNVLLLIAGLIAISGGMSFIALGRRTTTRR